MSAPTAPSRHHSTLPDGTALERVADIIRSRAAATPERVAMRTPTTTTTFGSLDALSSQVAQALVAAGVEAGDRVAYVGRNSPDFLAVFYGAAKAGAIATAVNILLSGPEVTYILDDASPKVVVIGEGEERYLPAVSAVAGAPIVISSQTTTLAEWVREHTPTDPRVEVRGQDPALILYSSGTTGHPKGVLLSGHNVAVALAAVQNLLELDDSSVAMAPIPFFHISGLGLALVSTLVGAELLTFTPASPEELAHSLKEYRVTHAVVVPTVIQRLIELPHARADQWSDLRYVIYGAAPINASLLRQAIDVLGCKFVQSYGLTESAGGVTILTHEDHRRGLSDERLLTSAGRPLSSVEIQVVDPDSHAPVARGERGEIWIAGDHVALGYWRNASASEELMSGRWLRTGDIGVVDEEGYLYVVDRLKDMIVSGGENIYPAEVERVLSEHPEVVECAVVGIPSEKWGEAPLAMVVRSPGSQLTTDELISWCRERLAHFKCPSDVVFTDALPRNASGKLLKRAIEIPVPATTTNEG